MARNEHSCHSRQSSAFSLSGRAINLRFEHPVFHPMICYFKGLFACATSRATINVPPDQCYERVLAQAFWVLHCLSQVSEYMRTIATLPLVTASLILGHVQLLATYLNSPRQLRCSHAIAFSRLAHPITKLLFHTQFLLPRECKLFWHICQIYIAFR